jgi:succinate dehydrogenase/fumarate reductase flavoprotein subunit
MQAMKKVEADVVVVGGGGSGMAAAAAAAERGANVILLEKNPFFGGTTQLSVGSITASGTRLQKKAGIQDTPDEHFEDMSLFLTPELAAKENLELRRVLVDNVTESVAWLESIGVTFFGPMPEPPHQKPRMHNVLPNSRAYSYFLQKACRRAGVRMHSAAVVGDLFERDGCVAGIVANTGDGPTEFWARGGVIIASGDFSASTPLKEVHVPHLVDVDAVNPASTGDGHMLGQAVGGHVRNGEVVWGPSMRFKAPAQDTLMRRLPPFAWLTRPMQFALLNLPLRVFRPFITRFMTSSMAPEPSLYRAGAILVNHEGRRFADERSSPERLVARQPRKEAFIVFDHALATRFEKWPDFISTAPGVAYAYLSDYKRTRPDLLRQAGSLEELARQVGLPAAALAESVAEFNANVERGAPGETRKPLTEGPFYALGPVQSWIVFTEGGLAVNGRHEAVRKDGAVIPGLYAAGSAGQGGVILAGHGHHIGWAITSGRRAGRFAAERARIPA